ncbi:MAG: 3-phosphoserine/phosphohydroxythreonine transaminase [Acidobacteria bacterium]|nr:3-phosphoserine/phosphohydroxythreonine transaminase [Acidobacteriota bacterium]
MTHRVYNFYAGPATLPYSVVKKASQAALDFNGLGLSILEISHRAKDFDNVIKEAQKDLKEIMGLSDDYHVLFLQGGASLQFHMIPLNLMLDGRPADYVNTGAWSKKAIKESKLLGETRVVASSEDTNFSYIPRELPVNDDASYLHITTNNTIFGTEFHHFPQKKSGIPLVADMSSDMLCRRLNFTDFDLIYAGAQKNMGPSGTTIVILKDELVQRASESTPTLLRYKTHTDKDSLFNTPTVFSIYVVHLVLKWIIESGGLGAIEAENRKKAGLLYGAIDEMSDFYTGTVTDKNSRSLMNVTFSLPDRELEQRFVQEAGEINMLGLKGHRSVGGIRASIYNAFPVEGVEKLVEFMKEFRSRA